MALEPDFHVQGANSISRGVSGTVNKGCVWDNNTGIDFTTGTHQDKLVYIWMRTSTPGLCDTRVAGGLRVVLGSGTTAPGDAAGVWSTWYVDGSDSIVETDGWVCYVVDPQSTPTATFGGGVDKTAIRWFGGVQRSTGTAKGQNFGVDQVSYGRGELLVSGTVATAGDGFKEIAAVAYDTAGTNRWGILSVKGGVIYVRGKVIIGHATNNTTFSSYGEQVVFETPSYYNGTNVVKAIPDASVGSVQGSDGQTTYLGLGFIGGSGTTVIDFGVIVGSSSGRSGPTLGVALNPGLTTPGRTTATISVSDAAMALGLYGTTFSGFEGAVDLNGTNVAGDDCFGNTFTGCGRITSNMEIRNCNILNSVAVSTDGAVLWDSSTNIQSSLFANCSRAIVYEATTGTPFAYTGIKFSGNTVDVRNESGGAITINVSGGDTPSTEDIGGGSSTTVNSTVSVTVTPLTAGSEVRAYLTGTATEVDGTESSSGSSHTLSLASGTAVDIVILCYSPPKIPVRIQNVSFTVAQNLNPFQRDEPNFSNP